MRKNCRAIYVKASNGEAPMASGFVILLGVVSLFADVTYEGARSIIGPYLAVLGASATAVGMIAGLGEFAGYAVRLLSGYVCDRTRRYWGIAALGYGINVVAVPLLALAGRWETAALLVVMERAGKGIRTPARDTMLSYATQEMGRGWGFAVHEALDQIGAVLGPLIVAAILWRGGSYRTCFGALLVPALLALGLLRMAALRYPRPRDLEVAPPRFEAKGLPRAFWLYLAAVALLAAGYVDFPLAAYHFNKTGVVPANWIPMVYALAMAVDALGALLFGRLFDRIGISALAVSSLLSALFAPLVFGGGLGCAVAGMVLWGIGMGAQESVMRAALAEMVPPDQRGSAYGILGAGYGFAWFLGSSVMGRLYEISPSFLILFSVVSQLGSVGLFLRVRKEAE